MHKRNRKQCGDVLIILHQGEGPCRSPPDETAGPARARPEVNNPSLPFTLPRTIQITVVNNVRCRGDQRFCTQRYARLLLLLLLLLFLRFTYYYYYYYQVHNII